MKRIERIVTILSLTILAPVVLYVGWLCGRCFVCDNFIIPTSSMAPTLLPGDNVLVYKWIIGPRIYKDFHFDKAGQELQSWRLKSLRKLFYNDIVVFNFPHHDNKISFVINNVYCKRVVALPGDTLSIVDSHYRNNNYKGTLGLENEQDRLHRIPDSLIWAPALLSHPFNDRVPWSIRNFGPFYIPRRGDMMELTPYKAILYHILLEWETGKRITYDYDDNKVWAGDSLITHHEWQHDYYFMAGDNVLDSNDSRYWGLVPEEYVVGVVKKIIRKEAR